MNEVQAFALGVSVGAWVMLGCVALLVLAEWVKQR